MRIETETAIVEIEFKPADLLSEIIRELIDNDNDNGSEMIAVAICDGIDQLYMTDQAEILERIIDLLAITQSDLIDE